MHFLSERHKVRYQTLWHMAEICESFIHVAQAIDGDRRMN